jgi:chaperonin GroES
MKNYINIPKKNIIYNKFVRRKQKMTFQPLGNRVLIKRVEEQNTTATGIIIPDTAKEKPLEGKVIAVGPDAVDEGINEGDIVVFQKYGGTDITLDGEEYLILNSDEILGVMK